MERIVYICAMSRVLGFRPGVCRELIEKEGELELLFSLKKRELCRLFPGNDKLVEQLADASLLDWSKRELEWADSKGIRIIPLGDGSYPALLAECPDAPPLLFYYGADVLSAPRKVSIVGTRLASARCKEECFSVVNKIAEYKPVIVSGLAYGIDAAAHSAALESGIPTIAVLPNGFDRIYPSRHRDLAKRIAETGGLLTEYTRNTSPSPLFFIRRNRIIAGISQSTIVVETRAVGGSIMTVKYAGSYNRDVYALPGRISEPNSYGCNYLISRNMASIFVSASDFAVKSGWNGAGTAYRMEQPDLFSFRKDEKTKILVTLKNYSALDVESICSITHLGCDIVSQVLLDMELTGEVEYRDGRFRLNGK